MKRRTFIKDAAMLIAATGTGGALRGAERNFASHEDRSFASLKMTGEQEGTAENETAEEGKLIVSAPMLQNFAETSVGVAFAVSALANGYVLIGEKPDLSDARKVVCGGYRLTEISDKVSQVRVTGLKPATRYFYKIGADRIHYGGGYDMKILGNEEDEKTYSFTTAGQGNKGSFCVINDTHVQWASIAMVMDKLAGLSPSCVIWNGDASNSEETIDSQVKIFLDPQTTRKDYASSTPYLFCPGNHDSRGMANRHLEKVWMFRQPEERSSRDWDLGRNFAVRLGDVALVGLDTAEDKVDTNPRFAGLFNSDSYRRAQAVWLKDVLQRKDIAGAPFLVAICHIPLFDPDPTHNPGDVYPADTDPKYTTDFAMWQRTCAQLWGPILDKAGCQLVITAHQHGYRYDAPESGRGWSQIVGGGPNLTERGYPTVIEGSVEGGKLGITVHNVMTGKVQETLTFSPRRKRR